MPTISLSQSVSIGGVSIGGVISRAGSGQDSAQVTLPAGNAGTLSTRTDTDTGTITATSSSHDITTSDVVDVFWSGGIRRGMTVGSVVTTAIPIDGGTGDNLPAADTAVVVDKQVTLNVDFDGDEALIAAAGAAYRANVQVFNTSDTSVLALDLGLSGTDGEGWSWHSQGAVTNPLASADVGYIKVSNGNGSNANTVSFGVLLDSDS